MPNRVRQIPQRRCMRKSINNSSQGSNSETRQEYTDLETVPGLSQPTARSEHSDRAYRGTLTSDPLDTVEERV